MREGHDVTYGGVSHGGVAIESGVFMTHSSSVDVVEERYVYLPVQAEFLHSTRSLVGGIHPQFLLFGVLSPRSPIIALKHTTPHRRTYFQTACSTRQFDVIKFV